MIPEKYIKEINGYYIIEEAIHPETGRLNTGRQYIKLKNQVNYYADFYEAKGY